MDACITPIRHGGLSLVQATSIFYVLIDDPYMMVSSQSQYKCFFFIVCITSSNTYENRLHVFSTHNEKTL